MKYIVVSYFVSNDSAIGQGSNAWVHQRIQVREVLFRCSSTRVQHDFVVLGDHVLQRISVRGTSLAVALQAQLELNAVLQTPRVEQKASIVGVGVLEAVPADLVKDHGPSERRVLLRCIDMSCTIRQGVIGQGDDLGAPKVCE